jgi:hypothetical protein
MIPMLSATLLIYLLAELAGVSPIGPIALAIAGELAWTAIKKARTPRRPRRPIPNTQAQPARPIAHQPVRNQNVTTRAVTKTNDGDRQNPDFILFTELLNEQQDSGAE